MYYLISKANKKNHLLLQEHTLELMQEKRGSEIDSSNPASRRCFHSIHHHATMNIHPDLLGFNPSFSSLPP